MRIGIQLKKCLMVCMALVLYQNAQARVINVPADYAKIGDAVYATQDGDEIVVAPGKYVGKFNFSGKKIIIRSTFNGDWAVVRNTILEGNDSAIVILNGHEGSQSVLRGFTLTKGGRAIFSDGILYGRSSHATIEYNLITGNQCLEANSGTIENCSGLIQNNIIENNYACNGGAFSICHGTIQNNLIRGNRAWGYDSPWDSVPAKGGAFYKCNGTIRNNTVVDNYLGRWNVTPSPGGFDSCTGIITNNIIYHTTMTQALEFKNCSSPAYCHFREARAGTGNTSGDPKFVNPSAGDFRLKSDSPCIDAGSGQTGMEYDIEGRPRALKGTTVARGDGSLLDIGAYEAVPKPVAVWLPYGGPPNILEGQALGIAWELVTASAGTAIRLKLFESGRAIYDFGTFSSTTGATTSTVTLPTQILTSELYAIAGYSVSNGSLYYVTSPFKITGTRTAVPASSWQQFF